jgi:hypothetical protein
VVHTLSLSNTQFAVLAVWGARKYDVPVREPLLALAAYFHRTQHPDGSWNYPRSLRRAQRPRQAFAGQRQRVQRP